MIKPNKLNFSTAGIPMSTTKPGSIEGIKQVKALGLDGMELEFVHGVRMGEEKAAEMKVVSDSLGTILTAHGPYYINLNSNEPEKIEASVKRILDTARIANLCGAYSITFHAGFFMGADKGKVSDIITKQISNIVKTLTGEGIEIWVRPETTGKATQWGSLSEIIELSKKVDNVLPCVDFSHVHARGGGGWNSFEEFRKILSMIEERLGRNALDNMHMHLAGIAYSAKGERHHLNLKDSDMEYEDLAKALKEFKVKGVLISESPNIEGDALLFRDTFNSV